MDVVLKLLASFSVGEWILGGVALLVIAALMLNFLVDAVCELWDRVLAIHGGPHAVDSARIHRETAGEVERMAGRAHEAASGAGAGRVSAALGSLPDADAARGDALLAELAGHPHEAAKLDRETDYARGTTLVFPGASAHRVAIDPWMTGRDL